MKRFMIVFGLLLGVFVHPQAADAYVFTAKNATDKTVSLEVTGVVVGNMMRGAIRILGNPAWIPPNHSVQVNAGIKTIFVSNAGVLNTNTSPIELEPGWRIVLNFNDIDIGVCFDLAQISIGEKGESPQIAEVRAIPSKWYSSITNKVGDLGTSLGKTAEVVGQAAGQDLAGSESAGGGLFKSVGELITGGSCKDMTFLIMQNKKNVEERGSFVLLTQQLTK